MNRIPLFLLSLLLFVGSIAAMAQQDTTRQEDLLGELQVTSSAPTLLPEKMLITQRILWGEK